MKMIVCDLIQASKFGGEFDWDSKKVIGESTPITKKFMERFNSNSQTHGKKYIVNVEATEEWEKKFEKKQDLMRAKASSQQFAGSDMLMNILKGAVQGNVKSEAEIRAEIEKKVREEMAAPSKFDNVVNKIKDGFAPVKEKGGNNA